MAWVFKEITKNEDFSSRRIWTSLPRATGAGRVGQRILDPKSDCRSRRTFGRQRGANGGYTLARPASYIHLNEVIRILDEDTVDRFCKTHTGVLDTCIHTSDCGIRPVIVGLHEIVQSALSEITLAELIGSEEKVDARLHQIQRMQIPLRSMRSN